MLHLLTEEHKKKIEAEYARRVWISISGLVILIVILSALFIMPAFLTVHSRYADALNEKADLDTKIATRQNDTSVDSIKNISTSIAALRLFGDQSPRELVLKLMDDKVKGISISTISYIPNTKGPASINISGKADSRSTLVSFSEKLKADKSFSGVDVPLSSFAREKDIDFTMKLSVNAGVSISDASNQKVNEK